MPNAVQLFVQILTTGKKIITSAITSSAGAADGGKVVATDPNTGKIDSTLLPTGIGQPSLSVLTSEALVVGPVNTYTNTGVLNARKASANARGTKATGYVTQAYASGAMATVYFDNAILAGLSGLTPDAEYYLDTVAGGVTTTPPTSGAGKIVQYLGVAKSATELIVDIEEVYEFAA